MMDRRTGPPDRRASRRGGRRSTDAMRSEADALRLQWDQIEIAGAPPAVPDRLFADDDVLQEPAGYGNVRRALVPPRK